MKKFFALIKKLLRIGTKKSVQTLGDVVERLDWAEREVAEARTKLVDLAHKLHDGIVELEEVAVSAESIVKRHQEIAEKAANRKDEFTAKAQAVNDLLDLVDSKIK